MLSPLISDASWPHGRLLQARDLNNWAPRIGLALRPFGGNETVIRASYGIFYTPFDTFYMQRVRFNKPFVNQQTFVNQLDESGVPVFTIDQPFPEGSGIPSSTGQGFQADWAHGYNQQYNVTVEQALSQTAVFELGYIGNKGTKLIRDGNLNQAPPGPGQPRESKALSELGVGGLEATDRQLLLPRHASQSEAGVQQRFPGEHLLRLFQVARLRRQQPVRRSGRQREADPFDCAAEWGRSSSDYRQRFVYNFVYQIPVMRGSGHGLAGAILGDWNISSIGTFSSSGAVDVASPFDPTTRGEPTGPISPGTHTAERPGTPSSGSTPGLSRGCRIRRIRASTVSEMPDAMSSTVPAGPRSTSLSGSRGTSCRKGPGSSFGLILQHHHHTNFDLPNTLFTGGAFATMGNAGNSRHLQFGLNIEF